MPKNGLIQNWWPRSVVACAMFLMVVEPSQSASQLDRFNPEINRLASEAKYADAMAQAQAYASAARQSEGGASTQLAHALSWQGFLFQVQNQLDKAGPLYAEALKIYQASLPPDHPDLATGLNNYATYQQMMGNLGDAEVYHRQALDIREKAAPANAALVADSLNNLAQVYKAQERPHLSEPLLRRALELRSQTLPATHPLIAQSLQNLASVYELQMEFKAAEKLLRQALDIRKASQSPGHPEIAGAISKLAQNLSRQAQFKPAEVLFREAIAIRRTSQPPDHPDIANSLSDLGVTQMEAGNLDDAELLLREALSIRERALPGNHPSIARALYDVSEVALRQERTDDALSLIRRGSKIRVERTSEDKISRGHFLRHVSIAHRSSPQASTTDKPALLDEAFQFGQLAEQSTTAKAVARMAAQFTAADKELQSLVRERGDIERLREALEQQLAANLALPQEKRADHDAVRRQLFQIAERDRVLNDDLRVRFPEYFELVKATALSSDQVARLLKPDEALVSIVSGYNETFIWAVTKDGADWHRSALGEDDLAAKVKALRSSLDIAGLDEKVLADGTLYDRATAYELYRELLEPLEPVFSSKKHLLIVPSGALTSLPFQLLITKKPEQIITAALQLENLKSENWLINQHALSVLPSIGSLKAVRSVPHRDAKRRPIIGFGNPQFGDGETPGRPPDPGQTRGILRTPVIKGLAYGSYWNGGKVDRAALTQNLSALPDTEDELRSVGRQLGALSEDLKFGKDASETTVKTARLDNYEIVYFATHGLVAGEVGGLGEPALALTIPAEPSAIDDGLLTASEVSELKLDADWVVLASCNTDAPDQKPGAPALSGLAKAFFHAGARTLLVSHWSVSSSEAARLTTSTFENLARQPGVSRAEALRLAMLSRIQDKDDPWSAHPAFWAPFTIVGEGAQ